ncbi:MAG: hypothetical protein ABIO19_02365 [Burkholderiaceae bacterium]
MNPELVVGRPPVVRPLTQRRHFSIQANEGVTTQLRVLTPGA